MSGGGASSNSSWSCFLWLIFIVVHPAAASTNVELSGGGRPSLLRRHLHRHVDPVRRGLPRRMRLQIDLREQLQIGGPDRICERLLTATLWVWGGRQADAVATRAGHPRSMLKAPIELLRSARLTDIESLC